MNAEMYEKIVTDRLVFGKPATQIAREIERTESSVFSVISAFESVRDKDWNRALASISNNNIPLSPYEWAGKKLDIELPPALEAAYQERRIRIQERDRLRREKQKAEETAPETAQEAPEPDLPRQADNTGIYLLKILEAIKEQNELLNQLMDAVIPKYVGDMKDNVNANSDCLFNQLKDISDTLGFVKNITRKRGM